MSKYSVAVIICWYGEYPWYFPYFIHSCSFNESIDFIIITDNKDEIQNCPSNVRKIFKRLEEIKIEFSQKLGFTVSLDYAYKFCDFKPAYGFLFPEVVKDYDFWAQSDLDLIFGDIRKFMTDEILSDYDFINVRHDYTTGVFALYKNTTLMNTFFMRSKDYKKVFSEEKHFCFDECNFAWEELEEGKSIFDVETEIESFTHLIKASQSSGEIKSLFDFIIIEGTPGKIVFDNGKVIYKNEIEAFMYHFIIFKRSYFPKRIRKKIPNTYRISPTTIYH